MIKSSLKAVEERLFLTLDGIHGWTNVWYERYTQCPFNYDMTLYVLCSPAGYEWLFKGCWLQPLFCHTSSEWSYGEIYGGCDDNVIMITDKALTSNPILAVNSMRELLTFVQSSVSPLLHSSLLFGHLVNMPCFCSLCKSMYFGVSKVLSYILRF